MKFNPAEETKKFLEGARDYGHARLAKSIYDGRGKAPDPSPEHEEMEMPEMEAEEHATSEEAMEPAETEEEMVTVKLTPAQAEKLKSLLGQE